MVEIEKVRGAEGILYCEIVKAAPAPPLWYQAPSPIPPHPPAIVIGTWTFLATPMRADMLIVYTPAAKLHAGVEKLMTAGHIVCARVLQFITTKHSKRLRHHQEKRGLTLPYITRVSRWKPQVYRMHARAAAASRPRGRGRRQAAASDH